MSQLMDVTRVMKLTFVNTPKLTSFSVAVLLIFIEYCMTPYAAKQPTSKPRALPAALQYKELGNSS
jgi:hypothetical protein